jgi:hypothetical protein
VRHAWSHQPSSRAETGKAAQVRVGQPFPEKILTGYAAHATGHVAATFIVALIAASFAFFEGAHLQRIGLLLMLLYAGLSASTLIRERRGDVNRKRED